MSGKLAGKVAVVTGGGAGYGRGIVEKLRNEGAEVVIADMSESAGTQAAANLDATFVQANVAKRSDWQSILETAIRKYGKLDIVVNNAGACYMKKPSETVSEDEFDLMMNVNVKAIFHSVAVIVPYLLARKHTAVFVNIASTCAIRPRPELTWYSASKAGTNAASNSLAIEYAARGLRFNTICPVVGLTAMTDGLAEMDQRAFASAIPMGRMCTPADVANAVAYLASDDAAFITGVNLQVDGGRCV